MKLNKISGILLVAAVSFYASCRPDPPPPDAPTTGSLKIYFDNVVGAQNLVLNTGSYQNENNDTFNVTLFKYYISNIKLYTSSGSHYDVPNSYYLIDESSATSFTIDNIPNNTYTSIEFMLGVDSTRNVSGVQSGALDPGNNMFWSWSTGYIMLKMEGTSPSSSATQNALLFHVGGFSGPDNVLKTITPDLGGNTIKIEPGSSGMKNLYFKTDLLEMFKSPATIDFSVLNGVHMAGTSAKMVADNYEDMITFDHIN